MRDNNKISTKLYTARKENEDDSKMKFYEFKAKVSRPIDMKVFALNSSKYSSSYDQNSPVLIKCPLLKSPYSNSHASQFTRNLSLMNREGNTIKFKLKIVGCHSFCLL